jgi:hypothetical protein
MIKKACTNTGFRKTDRHNHLLLVICDNAQAFACLPATPV